MNTGTATRTELVKEIKRLSAVEKKKASLENEIWANRKTIEILHDEKDVLQKENSEFYAASAGLHTKIEMLQGEVTWLRSQVGIKINPIPEIPQACWTGPNNRACNNFSPNAINNLGTEPTCINCGQYQSQHIQ